MFERSFVIIYLFSLETILPQFQNGAGIVIIHLFIIHSETDF